MFIILCINPLILHMWGCHLQEKNRSIFLLILIPDFAFCISLAICKEIK